MGGVGRHRRPGTGPHRGANGPGQRWRRPGSRWPALFGVRPRQVVFTSGGTEAVNTAVWGATRGRPGSGGLLAAVEHSAARDASGRAAPVLPSPSTAAVGSSPVPSTRRSSGAAPARPGRRPGALPVGQPRGRDRAAGGRGRGAVPANSASSPMWTRWRRPGTSLSTSARSGPTWCRSPPTSSGDRPASVPSSSGVGSGSNRSWSAVSRSGPGGPDWSTSSGPSASVRRPPR